MRTFTLFTVDSRYSVPTLTLLATEDEAEAIALARDDLARSELHISVEVREGDKRIYHAVKPDGLIQLGRPPPPDLGPTVHHQSQGQHT